MSRPGRKHLKRFVATWLAGVGLAGCGPAPEPESASRTAYLSGLGQWVRMPQGMHATGSGTNLWTNTEGTGTTNPASGGRVVLFVEQASID